MIISRIKCTINYNFRADIVNNDGCFKIQGRNSLHTRTKFLIDIFSKCLCRLVARCANAVNKFKIIRTMELCWENAKSFNYDKSITINSNFQKIIYNSKEP